VAEPTEGAACSLPASLTCTYNATACCDNVCCGAPQYFCVQGMWSLPEPPCAALNPPACPTSPPDVGDTCNPCDYPNRCPYCDGGPGGLQATCGDGDTWTVLFQDCGLER
jgi:hypothetical protein